MQGTWLPLRRVNQAVYGAVQPRAETRRRHLQGVRRRWNAKLQGSDRSHPLFQGFERQSHSTLRLHEAVGVSYRLSVGVLSSLLLGSCSGSSGSTQQATAMQQPAATSAPAAPSSDPASACTARHTLSSEACDACLERVCCDAVAACSADAECNDAYSCLSICLAQPELEGCPGRCFGNGAPLPLFDAILACVFDPCTAECTVVVSEE